uniref:Tail spike protein n=1 Tax=Serratia phage Kevin TaxID=3161161 RepID=A0AAU8KWB2_9CAUD
MSLSDFTRPGPNINDSEPGYYKRRGTFFAGAIVFTPQDVVYHTGDWYCYTGEIPSNGLKVAPNSTPDVNWKNVGDATVINKTVGSWNELKRTPPRFAGQTVTMISYYSDPSSVGWLGPRGGKPFVAVKGNMADDGGFICVPTGVSGWYWKAMVDELNLFDFGVKVSDRQANVLNETSAELQRAINSSIANKLPLVSSLYVRRSGYAVGQSLYINKGIDISGIKEMRGNYALIYKASEFVGAKPRIDDDVVGCGYVVLNMNCDWGDTGKIYGTSYGEQQLGCITDYSLEGRVKAKPMNGQIHTASGSNFEMLASIGAYGYGVRLADTYDSIVQDVRSLFCGYVDQVAGIERYGLSLNSYTKAASTSRVDETNAVTVLGLMAHNCYDVAWNVSGTKNNVVRVHEEGTYVTTTWRATPTNNFNNNGYGYCNSVFASQGGALGSVSVLPDSSSTFPHVFTFMGWANTLDSFAGQNVGVSAGYSVFGGTIGSVQCTGGLYMVANARTTVSHISVAGDVTVRDDSSTILGGNITGNLGVAGNAKFSRVVVNGTTNVTNGYPTLDSCHFNGSLSVSGGEPAISNCRAVNSATFSSDALVTNTRFMSTLTVTGSPAVQLDNCRVAGAVVSSSDEFTVSNSRFSTTFSGAGRINHTQIVGNISTSDGKNLWLSSVTCLGSLAINGQDVRLYVQRGRYDRIDFTSGCQGTWEFSPAPYVNTSISGWVLPTIVTGYGRQTTNPQTMKTYTLVGGTWAEYTTH